MNKCKRITTVIFIAVLLFSTSLTVYASGTSDKAKTLPSSYIPKIVKVGISDSAYFSKKQENGSYSGILIDYLQEIAKYTGWKLEYVYGSTPDELANMLKIGEVDLVGAMLKNEYTMSHYDFADYNSGYSYTTLITPADSDKYRPMDYSSFNGMRVGIFKKAVNRIPAFDAFVKTNGLHVTSVYYDNSNDLKNALQSGEVDAILSNDTSIQDSTQIIAKFASVPYYFTVTKGNTELLRELNIALSTILEVNPQFDDMAYEKHFNSAKKVLSFSKEEETFIKNSGPLKVAIVSNLAPIESRDQSSGKIFGITFDILESISSHTGLKFEFIYVDTLEEAKKSLLNREADLITGFGDNNFEDELGIVYTRYYLDSQRVMVKNSSPKKDRKNVVAVPNGYSFSNIMEGYNTIIYDTVEECIQAVISGNADYTTFNNLVIDHYTYLRGNDRVSLTPVSNTSDGLSFGLAQPASPALLSILDKTIYNLTADEIQSIVYENTTTDSIDITFTSFIYSYPMGFTLIASAIVGILLIAILLLILFIRTKLRLAQQITLRGDSYRIISELTDEYIFDYDFETLQMTLPETFAHITGRKMIQSFQEITKGKDAVIKTLFSTFTSQDTNSRVTVEFECPLVDGKEGWFKVVGTVLMSPEKKPIRGIGRITSIQKEKQEKQVLEIRANTDSLTGLYNRQYSEQKIMEYFEQNKGSKRGVLMVIDLDYFKKINDTLGHLAGDQVLKEFAQTLTTEFRSEDIIGRWGGDEFIAFINSTLDEKKITERAQHLCQIMNREFHYEGKSHLLSISVGIALAYRSTSYNELFQNADAALYAVKNNQRNGYKIY